MVRNSRFLRLKSNRTEYIFFMSPCWYSAGRARSRARLRGRRQFGDARHRARLSVLVQPSASQRAFTHAGCALL